MPAGLIGKVGITVSGANSRRLYAVIEATAGGLYRSDDAGDSWTLANAHRDLWQRAFYFNRLVADPKNVDTVYILNFEFLKSTDAGATYHVIPSATIGHIRAGSQPRFDQAPRPSGQKSHERRPERLRHASLPG